MVVSTLGEILEKPRNEKEHIAVLKALRDTGWHKVYTAVVLISPREDMAHPGYRIETHVEETAVRFDSSGTFAKSQYRIHYIWQDLTNGQ